MNRIKKSRTSDPVILNWGHAAHNGLSALQSKDAANQNRLENTALLVPKAYGLNYKIARALTNQPTTEQNGHILL
jgi:hypothetical protein